MRSIRVAAAAITGYLLGTIPSADVAAGLATDGTVDLRASGSGNPGGANAVGVLGKKWGYGVMGADIAKAALAARIGQRVAGATGAHVGGTASVIGHCFPVWNGFKGGKGVACSVGQCLATFPAYFPIDLGVAAVTSTRSWKSRAFAATNVASVFWVVGGLLWWRRGWANLWGPKPTKALPIAAATSSAVIVYRFATARPPAARR
ncbi:MAG TPA: glycerol-3-phosphate acyltransferase [Acidimicrobiales bacterium]|nr:glycerol-3-phosphate acyltransferase [Acidimicrobiales bacterium]